MLPTDFNKNAPGSLVQSREGKSCYAPAPLPPSLRLDMDTSFLLSQADLALGRLSGVVQMLANPNLLISPFLQREAILSSRIEGTIASAQQIANFQMDTSQEPASPDIREVSNYVLALKYGIERVREIGISLRLVRELHDRLLRGVRGSDRGLGEFRTVQNWIGRAGTSIENARYVPPAVPEMTTALGQWEKYVNSRSEFPFLIDLALAHYQFEAIHPFEDGNGRVGRMLISLMLADRGVLTQPLLYLSAYFDRYSREYGDLLLRVSQQGAWSEWIRFFLRGVQEQSVDAWTRCQRLLQLQQEYRQKMQKVNAPALGLRLVDHIFSTPMLTVREAERILGVTFRSAKKNLEKLVAEGILTEANTTRGTRFYIAKQIIELTEGSV